MTYIQCSICKLSTTHQEHITRSRERGLSYVDISKEITALAGFPVSHYAVRRHLLNHSDMEPQTNKSAVGKNTRKTPKEAKSSRPGTAFVELDETCGRTMEGKQRWVVGCATNDNGSSWYSTTRGVGDSDPGMTVINIVDGEFAPQNVYFLKA